MPHKLKCKICSHEIKYASSDIGTIIVCPKCQILIELTVPVEIEKPRIYPFPKEIKIQIVDQNSDAIKIPNIAVIIRREILIGPFYTDKDGGVTFTNQDYEDSKQDNVSAGLWESKYRNYDQIKIVHVQILSKDEIDQLVQGREKNWNILLENESKRWNSIKDLLLAMRKCNNVKIESAEINLNLENIDKMKGLELKIKTKTKKKVPQKKQKRCQAPFSLFLAPFS